MAVYNITPVPKPRMTQRDKWQKRPEVLRYRAFRDECVLRMGEVDLDGADIVFLMPMPKSWSNKKRIAMLGEPHRQKPDLDNLLKALGDALYGDDSYIATLAGVRKRWNTEGAIIIVERERD